MLAERAAAMDSMQRAVGYMVNRKVAMGFTGWVNSIHASTTMSQGLKHMLHRQHIAPGLMWPDFTRMALGPAPRAAAPFGFQQIQQ